jgi:hypothetical protein
MIAVFLRVGLVSVALTVKVSVPLMDVGSPMTESVISSRLDGGGFRGLVIGTVGSVV